MSLRLRFEDTNGQELLDDTLVEPTMVLPIPGDVVFLVETSLLVKRREFFYDGSETSLDCCTVVIYCESDFSDTDVS